jgi:hypothetical protein
MHKRTLPSDPYVFGHPDLVFGQGALQGSAFANMTGTLAQIAHLAAYSAEIMDGVLRLSEELSHRIDETTHRSELLSKTLLLTEQDVVKASQGPVVSGQSRVDRAPYTEKLSRLLTKNSNDCRASAAFSLRRRLWRGRFWGPLFQSKLLPRRVGASRRASSETGSLRYEDGAKGEKGEKKGEARTEGPRQTPTTS